MATNRDLDALLDSALDEFDKNESELALSSVADSSDKEKGKMIDQLNQVMSDMQNPAHAESVNNALLSFSSESAGNEILNTISPNDPQPLDTALTSTMRLLSNAGRDMQGLNVGTVESAGEQMMSDMMNEFSTLGSRSDFDDVVDGVMRQLLSKDLMYEPMKSVCEKFPEWLARNRALLSVTDYERHGRQYQCFQRIIAVYETEPENFARLVELMYDAQQYGQPPAEIVKDLAPGLKFDEAGNPILPNMGPGMFPNQSSGASDPISMALSGGGCIVM